MKLKSKEQVSWMNMADEGSSAHLKAVAFPVARVSQIKIKLATLAVNQAFSRWGLPQCIKIDNGYPFVNPHYMDIPSKAKLWWIGLGIEVIQNNIASPQENGIVECLQGTCHRWVNPSQLTNIKELQGQLDEMSSFQRNLYQMPKRSYMTRIECYPELEMNPRKYEPNHFNMALVDQYLANQIWQRRIKQKGSTHFFGLEIQIGKQFGNTDTFITFDPEQRQWVFRNRQGYFLKSSSIGIPCQKDIKEFAVMSKN